MNWTPEQIQYYNQLLEACRGCSLRDTVAKCFEKHKFYSPVLPGDIEKTESSLQCKFPDSLKQVYAETDGIIGIYGMRLVMSLKDVIKENLMMRSDFHDLYMPFDHMLIFGSSMNGDLYFFPIHADGSVGQEVFIWDHESDSRSYFANSVKDLFFRLATDCI